MPFSASLFFIISRRASLEKAHMNSTPYCFYEGKPSDWNNYHACYKETYYTCEIEGESESKKVRE